MCEWDRMNHNSIHLSEYTVTMVDKKRTVLYKGTSYGKMIQPIKKRYMSNGKLLWSKEINLARMKGKYFLITVNTSEYEGDYNITTIDTNSRCDMNDMNDRNEVKYEPSGVVVTFMCILNKQKIILDGHGENKIYLLFVKVKLT